MPLWKWTGRRYVPRSFYNSAPGCDALLCCPGPSLRDVPADLSIPGGLVVAMNTAYPTIRRPDVWVGMDRPDCYEGDLLFQPFVKMLKGCWADGEFYGRSIRESPNIYFLQCGEGARTERPWTMFDPQHLCEQPRFAFAGMTFWTALHIAIWMGARRVGLVGADFGGADYHDDRKLDDRLAESNRMLMGATATELPFLRIFAQQAGVEIYTTSENSRARDFLNFVPLDEAIARAAKRVPDTSDHVRVHAYIANHSYWHTLTPDAPERGVMTGCDETTEWTLPWWFANLRKHNPALEVAFADWGMSDRARAWCSDRGRVVPVVGARLPGWLNKPMALLKTPFAQTVWLDTDCEVRGNLSELLESYGRQGLAAAPDGHNPADPDVCRGPDPLNTGVLVVTHGVPIVTVWARAILNRPNAHRGDQEFLNRLGAADLRGWVIAVMPKRYNWLRLHGVPPGDELVMHWTGPRGKAHIRAEIIRGGKALVFPRKGTARGWEIIERLLHRFGPGPISGAEIGVLSGRTSATLLRHLPQLTLTMIDRWTPGESDSDYAASGDGNATKPAEAYLQDMRTAIERTDFARGRRRLLRGESTEMAALVPDGSLDFIFIDGDHSMAGVTADLGAWVAKVRPGGLVCGHDWDNPDYPGFQVRKAVETFFAEMTGAPPDVEQGADFTWFVEIAQRTESKRLTA